MLPPALDQGVADVEAATIVRVLVVKLPDRAHLSLVAEK
jgi:hypothetical protein